MATGVAKPNAQGHDITSVLIALLIASATSVPFINHPIKTMNDKTKIEGTKITEILSAIQAIGAFVKDASLTICIILLMEVSFPIF